MLLRDGATLSEREKRPASPVVTDLLGLGLIEVWGCGKGADHLQDQRARARGR